MEQKEPGSRDVRPAPFQRSVSTAEHLLKLYREHEFQGPQSYRVKKFEEEHVIAQPKRKGLGLSPGAGRSHCMVSAVSVNLCSSRNCTCVAVSRRDEPEPVEDGPAGPMHVLGVWLSWPMGENSVPVKGTSSRVSDLAPSPWRLKWVRNKIQAITSGTFLDSCSCSTSVLLNSSGSPQVYFLVSSDAVRVS